MKKNHALYRVYSNARYTSAYTGKFIFFALRMSVIKFSVIFALVRFYHISLKSYSALVCDLEVPLRISLGRYLFKNRYSYSEIKASLTRQTGASSAQQSENPANSSAGQNDEATG
jgi:hypothetical protein